MRTLTVLLLIGGFVGCNGGSGTSATAPPQTASRVAPTPTGGAVPASPDGSGAGSALSQAVPFASLDEILRSDPKNATARARLHATALQSSAEPALRYASLHQLELVPDADTLDAARTIAFSGTDRWLVENAIGVLGRLRGSEARSALVTLESSATDWKSATAKLVARSSS